MLGWVIRFPIVAILLLLEPVVSFLCSVGLILGIVTCILWELSAARDEFSFSKMLVFSLGCAVFLFLYHVLFSLFVRDSR